MEQIYIPKQDYKVLVRCFTYNQSKYIEDALNGFAMQQTNFPFVCLVMDDCSTDGEQEVIKAWMDCECDMEKAENVEIELSNIILVPHKLNTNCTFAFYLLKQNLYGTGKKIPLVTPWCDHCEYEALCEGDDYWTHPEKLQKQVDYLDSHSECGLVYTKVKRLIEKNNEYDGFWGSDCTHEDLLMSSSSIPTLSACYRNDIARKYRESIKDDPKWPLGDVPMWLYFMRFSSIHFIDEVMGVYRILPESASNSGDFYKTIKFFNGAYKCRAFYAKRYWGQDLEKRIHTYRLRRVSNDSIGYGERCPVPVLRDLIKYKIFDLNTWIRCIYAKSTILIKLYKLCKSCQK